MCEKEKVPPYCVLARIYAVTGTECAPPRCAQVYQATISSTSSGMIVVFEGRQSLYIAELIELWCNYVCS